MFIGTDHRGLSIIFLQGPLRGVTYPGTMYVNMDEYLDRQFLIPIPSRSLHDHTQSSYELSDKVRTVLGAGSHSTFFLRKSNMRFVNPFRKDNVGILRGEGVIVFKSLE